MLETTNLECVRGNRRLFKDVSFSVGPGDLLQVTGANGSGKTSLLRMLCGLVPPTSGEVLWNGQNIQALGEEYFSIVTYIGHRHGVKDELTVLENLRVSSGLSGVEIKRQHAFDVLAFMGLAGFENVRTQFLSEGQRRRLSLARLVVCPASLWLLDEVLTSLDKTGMEAVLSLIQKHLAKGGMAIVVTHQELQLSTGMLERIELAS